MLSALGGLWLAGAEVDWARFTATERRRRVPLPTYPFERQQCWLDAVEPILPARVPPPALPVTAALSPAPSLPVSFALPDQDPASPPPQSRRP